MLEFILFNILMISTGTVLYVVVRALPRVGEVPRESKVSVLERWVASEIPERIDRTLNTFLAKALRKFRVWLLKADNFTSGWLKRVKANGHHDPKKSGFDFRDLASQKEEEKKEDKEDSIL